ncbi:Cell wall-active antibiotics response 4TMS YvqF [Chitinophaga terrae (ex Kim and Jung 2007)]|uniref:Cell wall-active antibiotics response 4TMS YvqF n=1 Tax=Chitinophaga terrae (ex Kim and Jung 2007) TaxID=408074 RepID=A0A1H4E575_9BACT|nr:DUF5668 domain-containing protein [Chitinophaga terrae (ex Kim and Jung 2007)]MDQ0108296.1 putative membrane protein [Chitinophaga terrae (ex Kim and Jung 2007)]GEP91400.1 hypothetical protein CTE07_30450 [Chitinophaga terrae (ex Kim and Jung 2007)]SEA79939.1 Cell wall-active antibiotics response 4TMS YvqF [Chitinophaga terrae (ex Kim and Jung 2007)]
MKDQNTIEEDKKQLDKERRRGKSTGGVILILIGAGLLLRNMNLDLPYWLFSWQMIVIVVGLVLGFKHNFRPGGWIPVVVIGTIFLLGDIYSWPYNSARFIWPVVLIGVGISVLISKNCDLPKKRIKSENFSDVDPSVYSDPYKNYYKEKYKDWSNTGDTDGKRATFSSEDVLNVSAIFGSVNKIVTSKNFRGGDVSSVFGGVELNLMKAELNGTAVLDVNAIMGGCEIIVPANWKVKVDITTILGGVDDTRPVQFMQDDDSKNVLVLTGSCIFGGVEIRSYA